MTGTVTSERRDLRDSQYQHDHCKHACKWNAGNQHYEANDDGLDEGYPKDALCHRTNGRRGELGKLFAPVGADEAIENGPGALGSRLAKSHDDSGNDE